MTVPADTFRDFLRKKKLKFTPERRQILTVVFSLHGHFDVDSLYEVLRRQDRRISRATIYRTLPLLIKSGLVRETMRCQGRISYEHVFGHQHHDHLLCVKCGKVIEFHSDRLENLQNRICQKYKFKPLEHRLGIRGYCQKCR